MGKRIPWRDSLIRLVPSLACVALAHVGAAAQDELHGSTRLAPEGRRDSSAKVTLEGFVLAPDGSPAEGAVVVSSAGGKAVTDVAGNYRLEVEVPLDSSSVQVTAVGSTGANLVASARVALNGTTCRTRVDPLALSLGSGCSPSWVPTFGEQPGTDNLIYALAVYDDGDGPELYAAGGFERAGGTAASRIARWDGSSWTALGSGLCNGNVLALEVYDDGGGPALYAGGGFTMIGGVPASKIAKWDGSSWTTLGSGITGGGSVQSLVVYDDGGGPALYAGGGFTSVGGVPANRVAKWNGSTWTALGGGMNGSVLALAVFDDGTGPALYAGGSFGSAGGVPASGIAKWNGSSWSALGSGMSGGYGVYALAVYDDGGGPALYAGGDFTSAGSVAANRIARWRGSTWSALGSGANLPVIALVVFDDGGGPALYAGGRFTSAGGAGVDSIARWSGSSWSALGSGLHGGVNALAVYDDGKGPALFAGGRFTLAGRWTVVNRISKWDGSSWSALGSGLYDPVRALATYDDGSGPALYAVRAANLTVNWVAKWDGSRWSALGTGMDGIYGLGTYDDGNGPALYACGSFTRAGPVVVNSIAKWRGSRWSALGSGITGGSVKSLVVYDDGGGPALYAGGSFTSAGGVVANMIAKWDGVSWSALGSGMNDGVGAFAVHDDGSGPALYAGGSFTTAGGVSVNLIAKWDGSRWSPLGTGMNIAGRWQSVSALAVFDDGGGPALYAGGLFTRAGGVSANGIARWDGSSWSPVGSGLGGNGTNPQVLALASYDDGAGRALYAGGQFTSAGGVAANNIAKWDGSNWSALGSGMRGGGAYPDVWDLIVHDDGSGPALYTGGDFTVTDSGDSHLAKWGCSGGVQPPGVDRDADGRVRRPCVDSSVPPVISCPPPIHALDRLLDGQEVVFFTVSATDDIDPAPAIVCVPPSGSTFPLGTTLVSCTATDCSGNQSTCQFTVTVAPKARRR